ncbi:5'-deoxyadenosine deaminase [candidate division KSB1 bacterium]|nr:5'-deoxyadenosine deaminase [candidate division KSB1 bacterium]
MNNSPANAPKTISIKNGTLITMNSAREIVQTDIFIEDSKIKKIGPVTSKAQIEIDATDRTILPGFIQTHTHLCQTLFRNQADDLSLIDWLVKRIWPLEMSHDENSITTSAQLGIAELFKGGTTTILDMGTIHFTDYIFQAAQASGIRAIIGKALMDNSIGVSHQFREPTRAAMNEVRQLIQDWHGQANNRLQFALTPRFLLSCSAELLNEAQALSDAQGLLIHTHAAESQREIEIINNKAGLGNIEYLDHFGLTGPKLCLAHCIWLKDNEMDILKRTATKVLHCPSSNLKLASGMAKVPEMLARGICVTLGADGAPCNNNLSIFIEMRLASLLQKYRLADPSVMNAQKLVEMATIDGACALGLEQEIGSLAEGKKADIIILNLDQLHSLPAANYYSQIVYSASPENVETVIVDGKIVMRNRELQSLDEAEIIQKAKLEIKRLLAKI